MNTAKANVTDKRVKQKMQEYEKFYSDIVQRMRSNTCDSTSNPDCGHNALVLQAMLEETDTINILCGKMSTLRESLYDHLTNDLILNSYTPSEAEKISKWIKNRVIGSFKNYITKENSRMNIFVIKYEDNIFDDLISKEDFNKAVKNKTLRVYKIPENYCGKDMLPHISKGDNRIVRIEHDTELHAANLEFMPSSEINQLLDESFESLISKCELVEK